MRKLDDNIVHSLNTTIPTASFAVKGTDPTAQCQDLYKQVGAYTFKADTPDYCSFQLTTAHQNREKAIKKCIIQVSEQVHKLRTIRDESESNLRVTKDLRKEQNKLRMMQNELHIEEVVRDRSSKVIIFSITNHGEHSSGALLINFSLQIFYERCRPYYRPASI